MSHLASFSVQQSCITHWRTVDEMMAGYSLIQQLYPNLTKKRYQKVLGALTLTGYKQLAYLDEDNHCLGLVGLRFLPRVWCELQVEIDNFVVHEAHQSKGIGKRLLHYAIEYAKEKGANFATLDTKVENTDSHRFYCREGFAIRGFHYIKCLKDEEVSLL